MVAAAAGDAVRLKDAIEAQASEFTDDTPETEAGRLVARTLSSLLAGRLQEARLAYLNARRILQETEHIHYLSQLQLAVGHLAAGLFPEADDAARKAEEYFHTRGADSYVTTYRTHAAKGSDNSAAARARAAEVAEAEPSVTPGGAVPPR